MSPAGLPGAVHAPGTSVIQTLSLGTLVALNLLFGVLAQGLVVVLIGPGPATDALFASLTLPQLLLLLTSGPAARVLVPIFSRAAEERTVREEAWTVVQVVVATVGGLALLLAATSGLWVPVLFPGFTPATHALTVTLARIQLAAVVLTAATTVLAAFHQSRGRFVRVEAALLGGTAVAALVIGFGVSAFGVVGVAWVAVFQGTLQCAALLPGLGRWRRPDWRAASVAELRRGMMPLAAGALVYKNERTVDRWLASFATSGNLSLLALGHQACTSAGVVLHRVVTAPLVPRLSRQFAGGDLDGFRRSYRVGAGKLLLVTLGVWATVAGIGRLLIPLVAGLGQMSAADLGGLWTIVLALGGYLVAGACGQVLSAAFYAQSDTVTPTRVGIVAFLLSLPLRVLGLSIAGAPGIALGSSAYHALNAAMLLWALESRATREATAERGAVAAPAVPSWWSK